jgi:hypothetical protein
LGTNPLSPDTDGDGVGDAAEVAAGTDPGNVDGDGDGLIDGAELSVGTDPLDADSDDDGLLDGAEVALGTDPLDADSDGDGSTDGAEVLAGTDPLAPPVGPCADGGFPVTEVVGDGVDQDCDGLELCWVDEDGDGFVPSVAATVSSADWSCSAPGLAGSEAPSGDCDDGDSRRFPGAAETDCTDPLDRNCDGSVGYADGDADGYAACEDCDDGVFGVNPGASEVCNGADDDCDGGVDIGASDAVTYAPDADGDGFTNGDVDAAETACEPSAGFTTPSAEADCDDGAVDVYPGASEVVDDGIDQDCDGRDAVSPPGPGEEPEVPSEGCSCGSVGSPSASWLWLTLVSVVASRRRGLRGR